MSMTIDEIHQALTAPGQPFEMIELEIDSHPIRAWKNTPADMRVVFGALRAYADRTFVVYEDDKLSYGELYRGACKLAHLLRDEWGMENGDRVAIAMRNFPEWPVAFWATLIAGGVAVPLNAWWTAKELEYGLHDSGARVLFADGDRLKLISPFANDLDLRASIAVRAQDLPVGALDYQALVADLPPDIDMPEVQLEPDDNATIFYTSGTTGQPKGALGTHRNLATSLLNMGFAMARSALRGGQTPRDPTQATDDAAQETMLMSVPFFHVTGCHGVLLGTCAAGGKLVLMYKWNAERALELIEREGVTVFGGVPSMAWEVLQSPDFAKRDVSSVKSISYGGAPAPPELVRKLEEMFPGRTPSNGWGMTETSAGATMNAGPDYLAKPDSVGVPFAVCDVRIVDDGGRDAAPGELGELWVRGPNVVKGYWNKPEATEETFGGGWLKTGDIARVDDEGFVYLVDRAKDMVIRGGENVYCAEVEAVLFEHPAVADAAVLGVPHKVLGEEVGAVIRLKPGSEISQADIQDHARQSLAGFKVPVHVWFYDTELPRNPAGKIVKRELKQELLGDS